MPIGKRPVPRVASGKGSRWNTRSGQYDGVRGNKSPMGARPVPAVAKDHADFPSPPGAVKKPIKHTKMPTLRADQTTGASRATGGGRKGGGY